jgi:hypothetical protein
MISRRLSSALTALSLLALVEALPTNMVASPPSTLLPPGVTSLALNVTTAVATDCRWDATDVPYALMRNDFASGGTAHVHWTTLVGLTGGLAPSLAYVQCEAFAAGAPLVLAYRSLPDSGSAPFPRLGNLWGSDNFRGHPQGLAYAAARSSLWLGSDWSVAEIAQLRALNPYTVVLTSVNACEVNDQDLPDAFYLLNITQPPSTRGRLESWPGAWRLDLTNPDVQAWQAQLMYCLVVYGGTGYGPNPGCNNVTGPPPLAFDGLFVDNVFMDNGEAVNSQDIYHNPFIPIDRATGKAMVDFNERWRSGMVNMIALFRTLMPFGILDGHAMDISDANITAQFNAISIGFTVPQMVEGFTSFSDGLANYDAWMTLPSRSPKLTMVESAVRFQLAYGYGFDPDLETLITHACANSNSVPGAPVPGIGNACTPTAPQQPGFILPQTFLLARSEYAYFRFGLGFTLMRDGYFTHELGDSWHGMDWVYDELLVENSLGRALGNATAAKVLDPNPPPIPPPIPLTQPWGLWVRTPDGSNASMADDPVERPPVAGAPDSVRVDIQGIADSSDGIDLSQLVDGFLAGGYLLSFWAKASRSSPVELNSRENGGDWHSFGLDTSIVVSSVWTQYNISFISVSSGGLQARLSWWLGKAAAGTSVWVNSPTLVGTRMHLPVLIRDFACGAVVLNGDTANHTVLLEAGLSRLAGEQAPLWQYFIDDASSSFQPVTGTWAFEDFDNGYHGATTPSQEEVRPANGFYHHWAKGAHRAAAGSSATFDLLVPVAGLYNVSLWWPAAVPARAAWSSAMLISILPPGTAPPVTVDLSKDGGDLFFPVAAAAQLSPGATLLVECPAGGGDCISDAVLVESAARYNDGSEVARVTLQPMDAIVLRRTAGC